MSRSEEMTSWIRWQAGTPVPCPALLFFKEDVMNLLQGNVKKLYSKYFAAAFGSALISSVYGLSLIHI